MGRYLAQWLCLICMGLALSGCGPAPEEVLTRYLDATLTGDYNTAYTLVAGKHKALVPQDVYVAKQQQHQSALTQFVQQRTHYDIDHVAIVDNQAQVTVTFTMPNLQPMLETMDPQTVTQLNSNPNAVPQLLEELDADWQANTLPSTRISETMILLRQPTSWGVGLSELL